MSKLLLPESSENYTLGGGTLLFSEKDTSVSGNYYGYLSIGAFSNASLELNPTYLDHFKSASGKRVKDKSLTSELAATLSFDAEEWSIQNLKYTFFGATVTTAAAVSSTATVATSYGIISRNRDLYLPFATATITVTSYGGTTAYTVTNDYTVENVYEMRAIRWVSTGDIGETDVIKVTYRRVVPAGESFTVFADTDKEGKAILLFRSDAGINWQWDIPSCQIGPSGAVSPSDTDWSSMGLKLDLLEDASSGFGTFTSFKDKIYTA